jgi:hypothetical protein
MITGFGRIVARQEVVGQTKFCSRTSQSRLVELHPHQLQHLLTTSMVMPVHQSQLIFVTGHATADGVGHLTKTGPAQTPTADANLPPLPSFNENKSTYNQLI